MRPVLLVIAGPNGSGKTTVTERLRADHWSEGVENLNREACVCADTVTTPLSQPPRGPHHDQPPPTLFAHETGRVGARCFGATRLRGWA